MYITQDQMVKRLERTNKSHSRLTHEDRVNIGSLSRIVGPTEAGEVFDVAKQTADKLEDAIVGNTIDAKLKSDIDDRTKATVDSVRDKLLDGISSAVDEMKSKINNVNKPQEAAAAAKMLAETLEKVSGRVNSGGGDNRVQILINAPTRKEEKDYEVITA